MTGRGSERGVGGAMQGQRWMNTERLYRHCECGDLLQEATGNGEEETERSQRGKKNLVGLKPRRLLQNRQVDQPMAPGSAPPALTWRAS